MRHKGGGAYSAKITAQPAAPPCSHRAWCSDPGLRPQLPTQRAFRARFCLEAVLDVDAACTAPESSRALPRQPWENHCMTQVGGITHRGLPSIIRTDQDTETAGNRDLELRTSARP